MFMLSAKKIVNFGCQKLANFFCVQNLHPGISGAFAKSISEFHTAVFSDVDSVLEQAQSGWTISSVLPQIPN